MTKKETADQEDGGDKASHLHELNSDRVMIWEKTNPKLRRYLEAEHKLFLAELKQIHCEASKSFDLSENLIGRAGCQFCDSRHKIALTVPIHADLKIKQHVSFVHSTSITPGHFQFTRMWNGNFQYLPSGEIETRSRCEKLYQRLNKLGDACARESSFRLQALYAKGKLVWASSFDLTQRHTFIPSLAVMRSGSTSAVRLCIAPTALYQTPVGKISYNHCLETLPLSQPKLLRFQLMHLFASKLFTGDLTQMFCSIRLSYESSLHSLSLAYKTVDNWPTLCLKDSVDGGVLHVTRPTCFGFGTVEAPRISKYCLIQATSVFVKANILSPEELTLCNLVQLILQYECYADDLLGGLTFKRLQQWCQVSDYRLPPTPPTHSKCIEEQVCVSPDSSWSCDQQQQYTDNLDHLGDLLLVKLATMLIRVLNFASFELKYLKGSESCQEALDNLVKNQNLGHDKIQLQVQRPSQKELNTHIAKLAPIPTPVQVENGGKGECSGGVDHLGHTYYPNKTVQLKTQTLSIVYRLQDKNRKSVDFHSFQEFLTFTKSTNPIFTKRSLFSCLARNCCSSGAFLVIFKAQLKCVIRGFIRKNRTVGWDSELDADTTRKLITCVETYFILVAKTIDQPLSFKYQAAELFLIGFSDGSENLQTFCISLLNRFCLNGKVNSEATHISLQAYSTHCDLLNIVDVEFFAFNKMVQAMQVILNELQSLHILIPERNRLAFIDSKVVLTLLRSRVDLLKKRQSHLTAKAQICLNDIQMSPFTSVGFISQNTGNHFADHFSKFTFQNNATEITTKYNRLFNFSWLCSHHPRKLEGISFNNVYQSSEAPALKEAILDSEWHNYTTYCTDMNSSNTVINTEKMLSAAVKVCENIQGQCAPPSAPPSHVTSHSSYTHPNFCHLRLGVGGENERDESEFVNRNLGSECSEYDYDYDSEIIDDDNVIAEGIPTEESESHCDRGGSELSEKGNKGSDYHCGNKGSEYPCDRGCSGPSEQKLFKESPPCDTKTHGPSETAAATAALNARVESSICVSDTWETQIERLMQRKMSYTLSSGSILRILTICVQFGRKTLKEAKQGAALRVQRQRERRERRQHLQEVQRRDNVPAQHLHDRHDWPAPALNLMKSDLGRFEECLQESKSTQRPPADVAAFHHLCTLYSCDTNIKGLHYAQYHQLDGRQILLLEARKQRKYDERVIRLPRLRHIDPESTWAKLLLKAAHNYVKGRNLEKAHLGLTNLSIYLKNSLEALLEIQRECSACRRLRGKLARATDAIKLTNLGPCDYLARAAAWRSGQSTVILDILGPLKTWSNMEEGLQTKVYAAVFLQMPLKTVRILPVESYAAADLLQTIRIYVNQSFRPVQLWVSDAGSNISRFATQHSGYEEEQELTEGKLKTWQQLATGERGKELKNCGVHVKICAKNHKVVSSVEQAVYSVKKTIYSFDKNLKTPLSMFDWLFVFSEVESCIMSRPLCSTSRGRLYSAGSIMAALERTGLHLGEDQIYVHSEGADKVSAHLDKMSQHLLELREEIGDVLISILIEPGLLDIQVRREKIKFRDVDQKIQLGDVFYDPVLYKKSNNITGSLVRLHRWSLSRQSGLFQKVGPLKHSSYITRPLDQLFLVAKGDKNVCFGSEAWMPLWNLSDIYQAGTLMKPYTEWGEKEKSETSADFDTEILRPNSPEKDQQKITTPGIKGLRAPKSNEQRPKTLGPQGPRNLGPQEPRDLMSQGPKGTPPVITKRGRVVKKPMRFQP